MKLDRFRFAQLVAWIANRCENELDQQDIGHLDYLTEMPDQKSIDAFISTTNINELLTQFKNAKAEGFIPAIKAYRSITGVDLKTAKETIERLR